MLAPAKVPKPMLAILYDAMSEAGRDAELQAKVRVQGIKPRDVGLEKFRRAHPRGHGAPRADPAEPGREAVAHPVHAGRACQMLKQTRRFTFRLL
jgi:hypothetical protein